MPLDAVGKRDLLRRGRIVQADRFLLLGGDVGVDDVLAVVLDVEVQVGPQVDFMGVGQETALLQVANETSDGNLVCKEGKGDCLEIKNRKMSCSREKNLVLQKQIV